MHGMFDDDGSSGAVIRIISAGGVEAMDQLMNVYKDRPRVLEDTMVRVYSAMLCLLDSASAVPFTLGSPERSAQACSRQCACPLCCRHISAAD